MSLYLRSIQLELKVGGKHVTDTLFTLSHQLVADVSEIALASMVPSITDALARTNL
jgi:hypothetical protein